MCVFMQVVVVGVVEAEVIKMEHLTRPMDTGDRDTDVGDSPVEEIHTVVDCIYLYLFWCNENIFLLRVRKNRLGDKQV